MTAPLLVLVGPTAVGKTAVALELAEQLNAEILSVDSRQVFRGMDIGTAKPTGAEQARVRHHLIDLIEPSESLSAGAFRRSFEGAEADVCARARVPLAVGGSGLYLRAVTHGLFEGPEARPDLRAAWAERAGAELHAELSRVDPAAAARLSPNDRQRVVRALEVYHTTGRPLSELHAESPSRARAVRMVGLERPRPELYRRIERRVTLMDEAGLEGEARRLWEMGLPPTAASVKTVGYREWFAWFEGRGAREPALDEIRRNSRRYAKRQLTWFRAQPEARWVAVAEDEDPRSVARRVLAILQNPLDRNAPTP